VRIGVFGAGYVGLVSAVGFAEWGHDVVVCEREARKVESIRRGVPPFSEPGLAEALARNLSSERLRVTGEALDAIRGSDAVFVAVGTPMRTDRRPDLRAVFACCDAIARHATEETTLVLKSTVPVDALDALEDRIRSSAPGRGPALAVNPEFLRQGSALRDFLEPDRVVLGTNDERSRLVLEKIYAALDVPRVATDLRTAALVKYASNAFLAVRVSFINEIAQLAEALDCEIADVANGIGLDPRIGAAFLAPGLGFGGSCLPKDLAALRRSACDAGETTPLLDAAAAVNATRLQRVARRVLARIDGIAGAQVAILGLAFKAGTDDTRASPALFLARRLALEGCSVRAHDPLARGENADAAFRRVRTAEAALAGADVAVVATAWPEYRELEPSVVASLMRRRNLFDPHNALDARAYRAAGFEYAGFGRRLAGAQSEAQSERDVA